MRDDLHRKAADLYHCWVGILLAGGAVLLTRFIS